MSARLSDRATGARLLWMDQVRGLAILLIVLFHGRTVLARFVPDVPAGFAQFTGLFAPFRIPLLMFLSGMLLGRSLRKSPRRYFTGKLRGIAWPYLVWSWCFLLVAGRTSPGELVGVLWDAPPYLWYLPYLLGYYAAVWGLHALRVPLPAVVVAALVVAWLLDGGGAVRLPFLFAFFVAGHLYMEHKDYLECGPRTAWAWAAGVVVLAGSLASAAGVDLKYDPLFVVVPCRRGCALPAGRRAGR